MMMIGSGVFVFFESDYFKIELIEIEGDEALSDYEIMETAGIKKTMNLVMVDEDLAEKKLEGHPMIREATVEKILPNRVEITFELREPILSIEYASNFIIIDDDLHAMRVCQDPQGLLTLYGVEVENFNLGHRIKMYDESLLLCAIDLVKLIDISDLNFIPSIHILGSDIVLRIHEDYHVNFGDGKNVEERFNAFYTVYSELCELKVTEGVIDVSTDGLPTYRPFGE
jgi:cell division protein FtsQ